MFVFIIFNTDNHANDLALIVIVFESARRDARTCVSHIRKRRTAPKHPYYVQETHSRASLQYINNQKTGSKPCPFSGQIHTFPTIHMDNTEPDKTLVYPW